MSTNLRRDRDMTRLECPRLVMSVQVMLLVLLAAFLHASWNAVVKSSRDKFLDIVLVTGGSALLSAIILPFLPYRRPPAGLTWRRRW